MIEEFLLWLLAAYGCASLLVALLERMARESFSTAERPFVHYEVLLFNSEQHIENVARHLIHSSRRKGVPIQISFVDYGSTDDTLKIMAVLERTQSYLTEEREPDRKLTPPITIDLRRMAEQESIV
ncbi:glycosyltransferase family 2 protein [Brevibacillus fulvus]|uniref:Uncharacterized protein n=1 Tax=Brevibacillus fulvus TaxID=1125967 RepID=A0A939BTH6_9BACL|nr:glycosyltransferase family 2 protein [Brevibacillus fulvus]MBM7591513.1 hypothetical protein [Brevibacillus fulvus]